MKAIACHFTFISIVFLVHTAFAIQVIKEDTYYWNSSQNHWHYTLSVYHYPNQLGQDTLQMVWDTTQNINFQRYRFQYNAQGLETNWVHQTSSITNPAWVNANMRVTAYDTLNNVISIKKYSNPFNFMMLTDTIAYAYLYDAAHNNRIIEKITKNYHPQVLPYYADIKDSFAYGINNEIIEQYAATYNLNASKWIKTSRFSNYNYLNTSYDKPLSYEYYTADTSNTWKLSGRKLFQYLNNNGLIVSTQMWYDWLNNYEQYNQITSTFDSCSHAMLFTFAHWNSGINDWVIDVSSKHLNTYSSDSCRLAEHIEQKWDSNLMQYVNYIRNEFVDYSAFIGVKEADKTIVNISVSPNPAAEKVVLSYSLKQEGQVIISLRTLLGADIFVSKSIIQSPGSYQPIIDVTSLSTGVYFLTLEVNGRKEVRKIIVPERF
ncbi:MAG: T9SS type A sorting domain-containing protein [Bacteroidetes bacterium]|nr:T9SS type A sorting domain-containing protein [Bacteroidota bacterium]